MNQTREWFGVQTVVHSPEVREGLEEFGLTAYEERVVMFWASSFEEALELGRDGAGPPGGQSVLLRYLVSR